MSSLVSSLDDLRKTLEMLRQEWSGVKEAWKSTDQDQWERRHVRNIEDVLNQHLASLERLEGILNQAHREVR